MPYTECAGRPLFAAIAESFLVAKEINFREYATDR